MAIFNKKNRTLQASEPKLDENGNPIIENENEEESENENEENIENQVDGEGEKNEENVTNETSEEKEEEGKPTEEVKEDAKVAVMSRKSYKITLEKLSGKKNEHGDDEYVRHSYEIKANIDDKGNVMTGKAGSNVNSFDKNIWSHIAKTETIKRAIKNRIVVVK